MYKSRTFAGVVFIVLLAFGCSSNPITSNESYRSWEATRLRVASLSASTHFLRFYRSLATFQNPDRRISDIFGLKFIEGDAISEIRNATTVHITRNLLTDVYLSGQSELVIGGDVAESSTIHVDGLSIIYIGGSFYGNIVSTESVHVYIDGSHYGSIQLAGSSNKVTVHRHFFGTLESSEDDKLKSAMIVVDGYTDSSSIEEMYNQNYVSLSGVFQFSNIAPGIYWKGVTALKYYTVLVQQRHREPEEPESVQDRAYNNLFVWR